MEFQNWVPGHDFATVARRWDSGKEVAMNLKGLVFLACCFFVMVFTAESALGVPGLINFQGMLTDEAGTSLDGTFNLYFRIYDAATGGTQLWAEEQDGVLVINGVYNVQLGVNTGLSADIFTGDARYLQVEVYNSDTGTWEVLSPRLRLTSTAFALRAGDAETLGGHEASELDQSSHLTDTSNPHHVTAAQAGADPAGAAASVQANLDAHAADPAAHHARYTDAEAVAAVKASDGSGSGFDADLLDGNDASAFGSADQQAKNTSNISDLQSQINALKATVAAQAAAIAALEAKLEHMSANGTDVFFSGVNVHIVNGTNSTGGPVNGLGNLIVGYNASRYNGNDRSGSHNIVVGDHLNYSSYGGLVVGNYNTISGAYASVTGGATNTASGFSSSVSGGNNNEASEHYASVSGGYSNEASASYTSVSGGIFNTASGYYASVSGGFRNTASGSSSSVSGGGHNTASGGTSSVTGGRNNVASGAYSFVAGGGGPNDYDGNQAFGDYASVLGGWRNIAGDPATSDHSIGQQSVVAGGTNNTASGSYASVSGGANNEASGSSSSVSGGTNNTASGSYSSVSGGNNNDADGYASSVSGGFYNTASESYSSVSGGYINAASGTYSSISGGYHNTASGDRSSVSGGDNNEASGAFSSVSGGRNRSVSGSYDWRAGSLFEEN